MASNKKAISTRFIPQILDPCIKCNLLVFKGEEILALDNMWHSACFTCGGSTSKGCNTLLSAYIDLILVC